jgi:hypothetical protein
LSEAWRITLATKRLEYMRAEAYWAKRRRETEKALVHYHVNKDISEEEIQQFFKIHSLPIGSS